MQQPKGMRVAVGVLASLVVILAVSLVLSLRQDRGYVKPGGEPSVAVPSPPADKSRVESVAKVGPYAITRSDLEKELNWRYGAELLAMLLDRKAVELEAVSLGIQVSEAETDQELKRMQQGYGSEEEFYRSMREQLGLSKQELREDARNKLLLEKITVHGIRITDEQVEAYIRNHPEEFRPHVQVRLAHIFAKSKDDADKAYADSKRGIDFELLARAYSQDAATSNRGGELGWIDQEDPFFPESVMRMVRSLPIGAVGEPVKVENGYEIMKVLDRRELNKRDEREIRAVVRKELALSKAPPLGEIMKQIRLKHKVEILDAQYVKP